MILNGLLLMGITLIPFPTALLAEYLRTRYETVATVVFSGSYLFIAILYNLLWRHISRSLLKHDHDADSVKAIDRQYNIGLASYAVIFVVAFFAPSVSVVINLLLAVFFALPDRIVARATGTLPKNGKG